MVNLSLQGNMYSLSATKQHKIILLHSQYIIYDNKNKAADRKSKGRIKYEMRVFVRGFNSRRRLIKHNT